MGTRTGRRRARGREHAARRNDAVEDGGQQDLAVPDDGDDIPAGAVGADAVVGAQAVGDLLAEAPEVGLGELVGRVGGFDVRDGVVLREGVGGVFVVVTQISNEACSRLLRLTNQTAGSGDPARGSRGRRSAGRGACRFETLCNTQYCVVCFLLKDVCIKLDSPRCMTLYYIQGH